MKAQTVFKFVLVPLFILIIASFIGVLTTEEEKLSKPQKDIINVFGYPHQFMITYLPGGSDEGPTLIRTEIWYYPDYKMQVTFMAGYVYNVKDLPADEFDGIEPTKLKSENYEFEMGYDAVKHYLQTENIEKLDALPGFFEEGVYETYISDKALFVIERGYLSYFQTIGVGERVTDDLGNLDMTDQNNINEDETDFLEGSEPQDNLLEDTLAIENLEVGSTVIETGDLND